jgi:hypothetical protein
MSESFEKCPTCGRFVSPEDGYYDLPPGGKQNVSYLVVYCDDACAERKSPPAVYEPDAPEPTFADVFGVGGVEDEEDARCGTCRRIVWTKASGDVYPHRIEEPDNAPRCVGCVVEAEA